MKLDKLSLDEMVQGFETPDENWETLLRQPDAEVVWSEAVKRREHLNAYCRLVANWPAIVAKHRQLKAYIKKSFTPPQINLFWEEKYDPFSASLGQTTLVDDDTRMTIEVKWGEQQIIELNKNITIHFSSEVELSVFYAYGGGEGSMSSTDTWEFELEEGAVLLTFIEGGNLHHDFGEALSSSTSVGSIVLLPS